MTSVENAKTMSKLAIIGANEFQLPLIEKAEELGYETHVFAWAAGDVGERKADFFYPISIVEKEEILEKCLSIEPDGVCSIGSDLAVPTVNFIQRALGHDANDEECDRVSTNKFLMREAFRRAGVPVPGHACVSPCDDLLAAVSEMTYPLIVKPVDRSGSRAVNKIDDRAELRQAVEAASEVSFAGEAIVEEFIVGDEFSCECISFEGRHTMLALTRKHTSGPPHFIEHGHDEPSGLDAMTTSLVRDAVFAGLDALGIRYGASHSEFFLTPDGQVRIVEIGARMGGDFIGSHLVPLSTGYDFTRMVIDVACGREPCLARAPHFNAASVRFAFSDDELVAFDDDLVGAKGMTCVCRHARKHEGKAQVTDSSSRLGYAIFVSGSSPMEA